MHSPERVHRALELAELGLNPTEISRLTGVHRRTVSDWVRHGPPRGRSGVDPSDSCPDCGWTAHAFEDLPPAYSYLLGLYLGDGCISAHPRGVFKLRIALDTRYPEILRECEEAMRTVLPQSKVGRVKRPYNCADIYSYSKAWPCLFPQHGPGRKHERSIVLRDWQWRHVVRDPGLLLRGLIHSDGCRFMNTGRGGWRHPRYTFCNVSEDIKRIFCDACDLLGLRWTVAPPKTVYVSRKADVALLDRFVGPKS
jgi:Homeodomain-like domain